MRSLRHGQEAAPLSLAGPGIGQPLVPPGRPDGEETGMPVADVAVVVSRGDVLVPGHEGRRTVHIGDRTGLVEGSQALDRAELALPGRVAPRVGHAACPSLHGSMDRAAELLAHRSGEVRGAPYECRGRGVVSEELGTAAHPKRVAAEAVEVASGADELLGVERVRLREAAGESPGHVGVMADADDWRARDGHAAGVETGSVDLDFVELGRGLEAKLGS